MRQATSKSGYLDVKLPARARGVLRSWKAWKRRWVVLHGLHDLASGATVVTLDMYSSAHVEGQQLERTTIYLEGVTLLQRAVSRSHPYSFCAEARHTLVYLAAQCETESQDWMDVFRNILWPPVPISDIDKAYCEVYPVAVIDPAFSNLYAVKGGACHLLISDRVLLFRCSHTGHPLLEWPPYALLKVCLANAPETRDRGKVLILQPGPECVGWSSPLHLFCPQAQDLVKHISMAMQRPPRGDVYSMGGTRIPFDFLETTESLGTSLEDLAAPELPDPLLTTTLYDLPRPSLTTEECLYQIPPKRISFSATGGENRSIEGYYDRPREEAPVADLVHFPRSEGLQRQRSHSDSDISKVGVAKIAFGLCQAKSHTSLQSNEAEKSDAVKRESIPEPSSFLDKEANEEEKVVLRTEKHRNSQGPENALSVCSSISSHDSGVQMCLYDEIVGAPRPVMDASKTPIYDQLPSEVKAVKFDSDVSEASSSTHTLQATESDADDKDDSCVTSESDDRSVADGSFSKSFETASIQSDGSENTVNDMEMEQSLVCELYSEIGSNPSSPQKEGEPVYEDLDKYRKDIHKLLGIPHSAGQRLANGGSAAANPEDEAPPPLPPRRPRFTFLRKSAGRKKDVAAFLGIEDPMTQQVIRFQQEVVASTPAAATEGIRRKNLYRFLGVDQKIASTLGSPEEKPTGKLQRRNSFQFGSNETQYDVPQGNLRKLTQSPVNKRGRENRPSRKISGTLLRIFKEKEGRNEDSSDSCSDSPMARRVYKPSRPRWSDPVEPHMELREKPPLPSSYYENRLPACPEAENGHQTQVELIPHTENSSDSSSVDNSPTAEDHLSPQSSALLNAANRLSDKVWSSLQELLTKQMEEKIVPHSKSVSDFRRTPSYETPLSGGSLASSFDGFVSISYLDQTNSEPLYLDMTPKLRERKMWDDIEEIDPNFLSPFPSTRERESMCIYQDMKYRQSIGSAADANIPPGLSLLIPQAGLTFQPKNVCDAETPASELSSLPWISVDDEATKQRQQNETDIEQESGISVKIQDCSSDSGKQSICDITITLNALSTSETVLLNNPTYSECLGLSNTTTDVDKSVTNNAVTTVEKSGKGSIQNLCENGQNTLHIHDKKYLSENIISTCTEDDYQLGKNIINGKFSQGLGLQKTDNVNAEDGTLNVVNTKTDSTEILSNKPLESLGLKIYGENWNRFFPQSDSESDWFQCLTYFDESSQSVHAAEDTQVVETKNKSNLTEKKVQTGKPVNKQIASEQSQESTQSKPKAETVSSSLLAFQERIARFNTGQATSSCSAVDIANCATEFYPGKLREIVVSMDTEAQTRTKTTKSERTAASSSIPAKEDESASAIEDPSSQSTDAVTLRRSGSSPSALARRKTYVSSAFLYIGNSEKDEVAEPVRPASDNILGVSYGNYLL